MESGVSMSHSLGIPNNPHPEPNQNPVDTCFRFKCILILSSRVLLGIPKHLFPVGLLLTF